MPTKHIHPGLRALVYEGGTCTVREVEPGLREPVWEGGHYVAREVLRVRGDRVRLQGRRDLVLARRIVALGDAPRRTP